MWPHMTFRKHYIIIGNRRHGYTLRPARGVTMLICESANINDRFPNDEIPRMLAELPRLIAERHAAQRDAAQSEVLRFRVTPEEKQRIERNAFDAGFDTVSAYLRQVALGDEADT